MENNKEYLGDGLYAIYDGYSIELRANDLDNPTDKVYLNPEVLANFFNFVETLKKRRINYELYK